MTIDAEELRALLERTEKQLHQKTEEARELSRQIKELNRKLEDVTARRRNIIQAARKAWKHAKVYETEIGAAREFHRGELSAYYVILDADRTVANEPDLAAENLRLKEALDDMIGLFSADDVLRSGTHLHATLALARVASEGRT